MRVKVQLTRLANAQAHSVPVGTVAEIALEDYLLGVVPSEAYESRTPTEALRAQAIASRTYALRKMLDGETLTDTPTHQSYDASLSASPRCRAAVEATVGLVLLYGGQPIQAYYSRSNGGWTRRTEDVWSAALHYYQSRIDHWDAAATKGTTIKPSHGVGMSQVGAEYAAKQGVSCADILAFYYPGATVGQYGGDQQMAKPKARAVCATARKCATQSPPIPYVWGKESATQQDCQGHVEYCVRANGGTMSYAGSNDMLRNACSWVGTLAEARAQGKLIPGALLFQVKQGGDYPAKYHADSKGNAQHVGLYIGDADIEITHASSSAGRVTTSTFKSTWTHVGLAKAIDYSDVLGQAAQLDAGIPASENAVLGIIATQKDPLNMRATPGTGAVVCKIPRKAQVVIAESATVAGVLWGRTTWTQGGILYNGWVCMDYVTLIREEPTQTTITVAVPVETQAHADQLLSAYPGAYVI
jgi:hypothetical protein